MPIDGKGKQAVAARALGSNACLYSRDNLLSYGNLLRPQFNFLPVTHAQSCKKTGS